MYIKQDLWSLNVLLMAHMERDSITSLELLDMTCDKFVEDQGALYTQN